MKNVKKVNVVVIVMCVFLISAISITVLASSNRDVLINEDGQAYGEIYLDDFDNMPDLIQAAAEDGTEGYVYGTELFGKRPETPEEAVRLQEEKEARGPYTIPLYESDGKTIIGEYWIFPPSYGIVNETSVDSD